jgi:para-nitrobenzyl esterase
MPNGAQFASGEAAVSEHDDGQAKNELSNAGRRRRDVLILGASAAALSVVRPSLTLSATRSRSALVEVADGKLRGETSAGVTSFRGIPYGASTGGSNRFLPPQPPEQWAGVRDATKLGHPCPQENPFKDFTAWFDVSEQSEDCLYLNVWSPEHPKNTGKLPVMVWLHGGGYTFESAGGPLYDGRNLALAGDVVVVAVNHRLNVFGYNFFDTTDERFASAGNAGHLDLVEALRWVRNNIVAFGGDPANVTIFGESGGGGKVNALVGLPMARGLFHKAIAQSAPLLGLRMPAFASDLTDRMYTKLGIPRGDIAALQRVPTALLASSYEPVAKEIRPSVNPALAYGPTFDGVVFKDDPWRAGSPAWSRDIPMIIGSTLHEAIVIIADDIYEPYPTDDAIAAKAVKSLLHSDAPIGTIAELVAASHTELPELSPAERLVRVSTDAGFRGMAVHQSELRVRAGGAPVYAYECRWRTPCYGGKWAIHAIDVPAIFGFTHYGTAWDRKDTDAQRIADDKAGLFANVQRRMMEAWATFARTGNPSTSTLQWPAYDLTSRATMTFDGESKVAINPRPLLRRVAAQIF